MMHSIHNQKQSFPDAATFRAWLVPALTALHLSPSAVAKDLGLGKNTLNDFLGKRGRDIRLGNAARVHDLLVARASVAGVSLPLIGEYS